MSVLFMDGFDAGDFAMKYDSASVRSVSNSTRFGTGKSLDLNYDGVMKTFQDSTSIYVGLAAYAPSATLYAISYHFGLINILSDNGATTHLTLRAATATTMGLYNGSTLLGSFSFSVQKWQYIELYAKISDTVGECIVKVDGVTKIDITNTDTRNSGTNSTIDAIRLGSCDNTYFLVDDFYISDSEFMGDVRIQTLLPTAAGSSTQLTPTGGANYANVADVPDSTATYNASSTVGDKDLYALGDLVASTTSVKCVQVNTHSWKDDAGTASLKAKIKSGATEVAGTTTSLPSSVGWVGDRWETDPNTSAAWTVSAVNSLEAGAEVA